MSKNLRVAIVFAALLISIVVGACVPVIASNIDAKAQSGSGVVIEDVGASGLTLWRVIDNQYGHVCYLSRTEMECMEK